MKTTGDAVDDFYTLSPKYRTTATLKRMVKKELDETVSAMVDTTLKIQQMNYDL